MDEELTRLSMILLRDIVRIAALPGYLQIESFPSQVVAADEIALDFDTHCMWALEGLGAPALTKEQEASLIALDARLDRMSNEHNPSLWTDDALRHHPEWDDVRADARRILDAFGWSIDS